MLSMRRLGLAPVARGAEVGAALTYLMPYYGACGLAMVRAALRRYQHRSGPKSRQASLAIDRSDRAAGQRPVVG